MFNHLMPFGNRMTMLRRLAPRLLLAVILVIVGALAVRPAVAEAQPADTAVGPLATGCSAPSATWTGNGGRLDVFQYCSANVLQKYWTASSGWSIWFGLGEPPGGAAGAPSATWMANGSRIDVFITGNNGHLYQKFWTGAGGWQGWFDLGGVLVRAPSASWVGNGSRLDVFGIGTDRRLYQLTWTSAGWSGWFPLDAPPVAITTSPSATWTANGGRVDVFVTGDDGSVYQKTWTGGGGWTGWGYLGGVLVAAPSASWVGNGSRLDVFGIGTDRRLYQKVWTGAGWSDWIGFATPSASVAIGTGPSATWTPNGGRLDVFITGASNSSLYQLYWTGAAGWQGWFNLG